MQHLTRCTSVRSSGGFWKTTNGGADLALNDPRPARHGRRADIEVQSADRSNEVWILSRHGCRLQLRPAQEHRLRRDLEFTTALELSSAFKHYAWRICDGEQPDSHSSFHNQLVGVQRSTDGGNELDKSCYSGNMIAMIEHPTNSQILYAFAWGSSKPTPAHEQRRANLDQPLRCYGQHWLSLHCDEPCATQYRLDLGSSARQSSAVPILA
jgi:hypothetical protein